MMLKTIDFCFWKPASGPYCQEVQNARFKAEKWNDKEQFQLYYLNLIILSMILEHCELNATVWMTHKFLQKGNYVGLNDIIIP